MWYLSLMDFYAQWKETIEREEYLESKNSTTRRLWTKMRTGCLELRIETGRWERVSVKGRQVPVPRELRFCRLCGAETEDAEHLLLRCPAYECERRTLVQSGQRAGINQSANSAEWWKWTFGGGGGEVARQLLYTCMQKRKRLLEGMGVQWGKVVGSKAEIGLRHLWMSMMTMMMILISLSKRNGIIVIVWMSNQYLINKSLIMKALHETVLADSPHHDHVPRKPWLTQQTRHPHSTMITNLATCTPTTSRHARP